MNPVSNRTTTYDYRSQVKSALRQIENDKNLHPLTREDIYKYHNHVITEGIGFARQMKMISTLRRIFTGSPKPAREWTREDIDAYLREVEGRDFSPWTKYDIRVVLRLFFKWLKGSDSAPEVIRLKSISAYASRKLPEEMLSEEEVSAMIAACTGPMEAAFISCLYETGCRPDELGSLRMKHMQPDQYGFVLLVNGKTGMRRTRVCIFARHLSSWLDHHPRRNDPEAVLWNARRDRSCRAPLSNNSINQLVKRAARRVGINKRVYPYLFRHSRATNLASHLTEAQMNMVFGWQQGSDMPRTYVHLSGRDVDGALLRLAGIPTGEEQKKDSVMKPWTCFRCETENPGTSRFCSRCSAPLDSAEIFKAERNNDAAGRLMAELINEDPALQAIIKERIKKRLFAEQPGAA